MINHDGMESLTAADDNILGWVCRAHGALLAQLEEHFGCGVAVNAYVTPAAADGDLLAT